MFIPGQAPPTWRCSVRDGILLQDLPFTVSLHKFHLEHYDTGCRSASPATSRITDNATGKSVHPEDHRE